jgi:uncharacterized membrane protein YfcA
VPALTLLFGLDQKVAIGTSLTIIIFTSLSGFVSYARQKRIFYRSALFIIIPSVIFSALGSFSTEYISGIALAIIFAILLFIIALHMLVPKVPFVFTLRCGPYFDEQCRDCFSTSVIVRSYYAHLFFWGGLAGFIGGITGIGGGIINVPALTALGMPIHFAVATSILVIVVTSLSGAILHQRLGHVAIDYVISFSIGAIIGAQIGAKIAPKIRSEYLTIAFALFLMTMSAAFLIRTSLLAG